MISLLRYNLKIVAPTLLFTGIVVFLLVALNIFGLFHNAAHFQAEDAGRIAEQLTPVIAAFFSAGVLDAELKRGVHELLVSKRRPLWYTIAQRVGLTVLMALLIAAGVLTLIHAGIARIPLVWLMLASVPSSLCVTMVALWTRIRFGNAFIGHIMAVALWIFNGFTGDLLARVGITFNPLFTLNSYSDRLHAAAAGALETTPYVDWWWVNKLALIAVSACIFMSVTRRVEQLVEGD